MARWARESGAAPAVACGHRRLTYLELESASSALTRTLVRAGVRSGDVIGVCLDRSVELVVAIVAVLKSGAAYLPFDPAYPSARLEDMRQDAGARVVLTTRALASACDFGDALVLVVDEIDDFGAAEILAASRDVSLEDLAYVIFTSGSTGRPKGVMVSHRNLAYSTTVRHDYYGAPVGRYLLLSSVGFDSSVAGLFWTLCSGGCLVLPAPGLERDAARLASLIESEQVTHLLALPSLYRLILAQHPARSLRSLRCVIVAGEACPVALGQEHRAQLASTAFFNEYGPTEATVWCTVHEVTADCDGPRIPIGRAIPGAVLRILKEDGAPAAPGESGELYVGGPGVARGYLNRPTMTAERFVEIPGSGAAGRFYRTGDLVQRLPDGALDFLGRCDHQVKIRGYRIELGEIESQLIHVAAVQEAVVVVRDASNGDRQLVAYVQPRPGRALTVGSLRTALSAVLPEFMLPSAFVVMDPLPRSVNGKIDRSALPAVSRERPDLQQPYVEPRTPLEAWLADGWAEELALDRVGIHDRFFELGGDSLRAARVVSRLQSRLQEFVFVVLIFEHPTVAGMADRLRRQYPAAVAREFGEATTPDSTTETEPLGPQVITRARTLLETYVRRTNAPPGRRSRAIFLLSPPRSGTTLLAAMLAGHPRIVAASELNLLGFDGLGERRAAYSGSRSLWREGAIRTLMALAHLSADDAVAEMARAEDADLSTLAFFGRLQALAAPRLLLDKSPAYGLDPAVLRRLEDDFDRPLYVHLFRHPYPAIRSFAEHHMDQVYFNHAGVTPADAGELVWGITHANVLTFLRQVPVERQAHVSYEALVSAPEASMRSLCASLDLPFDPGLLDPYKDKDKKILNGVYPESKSMGDPKFHAFTTIVTAPPADTFLAMELGAPTVEVARRLGYQVAAPDTAAPSTADIARARHTRKALETRRQQRISSESFIRKA